MRKHAALSYKNIESLHGKIPNRGTRFLSWPKQKPEMTSKGAKLPRSEHITTSLGSLSDTSHPTKALRDLSEDGRRTPLQHRPA